MEKTNIKLRAIQHLSRRSFTAFELKARLRKDGYANEEITPILEEMAAKGYLTQSADMQKMIEKFFAKGYGPHRIGLELSKKFGQAPYQFEKIIHEVIPHTAEVEKLLELARKESMEPKKMAQKFYRRGFRREAIYEAFFIE